MDVWKTVRGDSTDDRTADRMYRMRSHVYFLPCMEVMGNLPDCFRVQLGKNVLIKLYLSQISYTFYFNIYIFHNHLEFYIYSMF